MRLWTVAAAALSAGAAAGATPAPAWHPLETTHIGAYTLTVESEDGVDNSPRLVIAAPGGRTIVVSLNGGLASVKDAMSTKSLAAQNQLHSNYLYASAVLRDRASGDRLVVVFGAPEDPDPWAIRVLALAANGQVQTLLSDDAFELTAVADLNKDGVPELVGRPSYAQMDNRCVATYDPQAVYRLVGDRYVYDEALSKTYNLAHRYVWAGPHSREDVGVDLCNKPGPKLVPAPHG
jgi:hypothetical protein